MKVSCIAAAILLCAAVAPQRATSAQTQSEPRYVAEPQTFLLWEKGAPGAQGDRDEDKPSFTYYSPVSPSKSATAVIVAPGGSYQFLASNHEGRQVANWLNALREDHRFQE
jgi:hypothetical protein